MIQITNDLIRLFFFENKKDIKSLFPRNHRELLRIFIYKKSFYAAVGPVGPVGPVAPASPSSPLSP